MNCFQILAILGLETTQLRLCHIINSLWIAFKFWLYWDWKQHTTSHKKLTVVVNCFQILAILGLETTAQSLRALTASCELLSNFGYIGIGNNIGGKSRDIRRVVNCFQILAILGLETTQAAEWRTCSQLWIAFKFWLYWDWKQLSLESKPTLVSCELLSNFGYIGIGNNHRPIHLILWDVVNCFQILAILGLETTDCPIFL